MEIRTKTPNTEEDLTQSHIGITKIVTNTMRDRLGYRPRNKKQNWMTDEVLLFMDERRKHERNANHNTFRSLSNSI